MPTSDEGLRALAEHRRPVSDGGFRSLLAGLLATALAACTDPSPAPTDAGRTDVATATDAGSLPVGAWRDLGEFPCTPGQSAYAGCSRACGIGSCTGDPTLRVCTSGTAAECESGSAEHTDTDDSCDSLCPAVRVQCPASGRVRLLAQSYGVRTPATCAAAVRSEVEVADAGADAGPCGAPEPAGNCGRCINTVNGPSTACGWCAEARRCLPSNADGTGSADGTCTGAGWIRPVAGICPIECAAGETLCREVCTDLRFDRNHCGTCGHSCGPAAGCLDGACVSYGPFLGLSNHAFVRAGSGQIYFGASPDWGFMRVGVLRDRASQDVVEAFPLWSRMVLARTRLGHIAAYLGTLGRSDDPDFAASVGVLGDIPDAVRIGPAFGVDRAPLVYVVQSDGSVQLYDAVLTATSATFTLRSTTRIARLRSFRAGMWQTGSAGTSLGCAILDDGTLSCGPVSAAGPVLSPLPIADAVDVSIGYGSACVVRGDGSVWCWGSVTANRSAGEPEATQAAPVRVDGISTARWVSVGTPPGLGIVGLADGTVAVFGNRSAVRTNQLGPWPTEPWTAHAATLLGQVRSGICSPGGCTVVGPDDQYSSFVFGVDWGPVPVCLPHCGERRCGPTGCPDNGTCGACPSGQTCGATGQCAACSCVGRVCGDDGCGHSCGPCPAAGGVNGVCRADNTCCAPTFNCGAARCGPNGCGENCGCPAGRVCSATGTCVCVPGCAGATCGNDACGRSCGSCAAGARCVSGQCCAPNCAGRTCGEDGCGGSCGVCPSGRICARGPGGAVRTCAIPSGRGPCTGADVCQGCTFCTGGLCAYPTATDSCSCTPNCAGRTCGDNGCGGFCGSGCAAGQSCFGGSCVRTGGTCTNLTGCVSATQRHPTASGSCAGEITMTLTNRCGRAAYCQFRVDDGGGSGGTGIGSGATVGGELGGIWSCGHAATASYLYVCAAAEESITCSAF